MRKEVYKKREHEVGKSDCNGQVPRDGCDTAAIVGSEANNYGADEFTVPCSRARFSSEGQPYIQDYFEPDDEDTPDIN